VLIQQYFRPGTIGGSTVDASDILAKFKTFLTANVTNFYTGMVYRPTLNLDVIDDTDGHLVTSWTGADPGSVTGTGTGDPLSPALAWVLRLPTATVVRTRFVKGRMFFGIPSEGRSDSPGGTPSAAGAAVLTAAAATFLGGFITGTQWVVWARPLRNPVTHVIIAPGTNAPIIAASTRVDGWGTQRRRRNGF
jgi:hypothetical protein